MARTLSQKLRSSEESRREAERRRRQRLFLEVERLDERVLPSVTTQLSSGILSILADDGANQVQLVNAGAQVQVRESGALVDSYTAADVQLAAFTHGAGQNSFQNQTTIRDKQLRLAHSRPLTPAELGQAGGTLDALLVGDTLTLAGPSGAGFQLTGNWSATTQQTGGQFRHTFAASGDVTLHTALGELVFATPTGSPLTITTTNGPLSADFGAVDQVQWRADLLNTAAAGTPLRTFQDMFGVQLNAGSVQLGLRLGRDLGGLNLPLNGALPYVTASATSYTARFGDVTAQPGAGNPLTVAFDPQDAALYARVREFAVGASMKGYIPFRPAQPVGDLATNPLFGHLYGQGRVAAGDVPVTVAADAVLNLDAARNGELLGAFSGNLAAQILTGQVGLDLVGAISPANLRAGVNGQAQVGYQGAGHDFTIPVNATAVYTPGRLQLRGTAQATAFAGTSLAFVAPSAGIDVTADLRGTGQVDVVATAAAANVAGLSAANLRVALNNTAASLEARMNNVPGFGQLDVRGNVQADGQYALTASASNVTLAGFSVSNGMVTISNAGVGFAGRINVPNIAQVDLTGTVSSQGQFSLEGSGSARVAGYTLNDMYFVLTNTQLTAGTLVSVAGVAQASLLGTITSQGQVQLSGEGAVNLGGIGTGTAEFLLTNTFLGVRADANIRNVAQVQLQGTIESSGQYLLLGSSSAQIGGFTLNSLDFTLTNSWLYATTRLDVAGVAQVELMGLIERTGEVYLEGTANFNAAGFPLTGARFILSESGLTAAARLTVPGITQVDIAGGFAPTGEYYFEGAAGVTLAGFALQTNFLLSEGGLFAGGRVTVPNVGQLDLNGTVTSQGQFSLMGQASVTIAGFQLNPAFTLTNTTFTAAAALTIPNVGALTLNGTVNSQGQFNLSGQANVTIAGFQLWPTFTLTNAAFTATVGMTIPNVGSLTVNGTVNNQGQFNLTGQANVTIAGFSLRPTFTLTNTTFTAAVGLTIPNVGSLNVNGTVNTQGQFNLTGQANVTIAGLALRPSFTLNNTALTVAVAAAIPVVGTVNLSGTVNNQGQFNLTAAAPNINILFVTLTNARVTLTNTDLTVGARATNLPLIGTVDFVGRISGSSITFTVTLSEVRILGFTIRNLVATLNTTGLTVSTRAIGLPIVGDVNFTGSINSSGFSLAATAGDVTLGGFVRLRAPALTLNQSALTLSASTDLPVVGVVTFAGAITSSGTFTLSATAQRFTLLGFVTFDNARVELTVPSISVTVSARVSLLHIGQVDFRGTIRADGTYFFQATARLLVGGFNLGEANLSIGTARTSCINVGPFTTPPLPVVGPVRFEGNYCGGGIFGLRAEMNPTPPIVIGGIPFNRFTAGFQTLPGGNFSLTFGAGVGLNFGGALTIAQAYFEGTIATTGDFRFLARVDAFQVLGFSAVQAQLVLQKVGSQVDLTLAARANFLVANVNVDGRLNFNTGQFRLEGVATIGVAGFNLSNTTFVATNIGGLRVELHSRTNVLNVGIVNFDGTLTRSGGTYVIDVSARATFQVAGFQLADAQLALNNTRLFISVTRGIPGLGTANFSGTLTSTGQFDLRATANISPGGFNMANASLRLTNSSLDVSGNFAFPGVVTVAFAGYFRSTGQFRLTGSANVGLGNFSAVTAAFTMDNSGVALSARVNVVVAQVNFNGSITRTGSYSLTGSASVGLGGYAAVMGSFTLNNSGASVRATVNVVVASVQFSGTINRDGTYSLTGSANVGLGGYSAVVGQFTMTTSQVSVRATLNVIVATVQFSGVVSRTGTYSLTGSAAVRLGGFNLVTGSFTLNNSGVRVRAAVDVRVATVTFDGSVTRTGTYSIQATTTANFAGFRWNTTFTISNQSGVAISTRMGFSVMGFTANFNGRVGTDGSFSFTASTGLNFGPIHTNLSLTLSNTGFRAFVSASLDLTARIGWSIFSLTVGFRGSFSANLSISTSGTFNAGASFEMRAYLGISVGVSIGFGINNREIYVETDRIGFSVWGVGFHPFGRLRFGY